MPNSAHHLASVDYDGNAKLWDIRSSLPLASHAVHTNKALAVAWLDNDTVITGGADCQLRSLVRGAQQA